MNRERSFCLHFVVVTGVPEVIPLAAVVVVIVVVLAVVIDQSQECKQTES